MKLTIEMFECIGGMRPLDGGSPFDSASVVVRNREDHAAIAQVTRYSEPGEAEGKALTQSEWRALCEAGHAHALSLPVPLRAGMRMWLFSKAFEGRAAALPELRAAGVLLSEPVHDTSSDTDVLLVHEVSANRLRDGWAEAAYLRSREEAVIGKWDRALSLAEQAWVLGRGAVPKHWALLSLCYERVGRSKRAEGMIQVARRSHGEQMGRDVIDLRARFAEELPELAPRAAPGVKKARRDWHEDAREHNRGSLKALNPKISA